MRPLYSTLLLISGAGLAASTASPAPGAPADKVSTASASHAAESAQSALRRFDAQSYRSASVAFVLMDAESGQVLFEREPLRSMTPASIVKAITTAAALDHFSPDHRFSTALESSGTVTAAGILEGDLVIRGAGDPALGSSKTDGSVTSSALLDQWTSAVRAAGIRSVRGAVVGDASCVTVDPVPDGFAWIDIGNGYGTGTSGLCFNDNMCRITFKPGAAAGDPAPILRTSPAMPEFLWTNEMLTGPPGSGDQGVIYGAPFSNRRWARGTVPAGEAEFSMNGSLPDPADTLARLLRERLAAAGVSVEGGSRSTQTACAPPGRVLSTILSPPLSEIMHSLNKQSINLYAEMMLIHTGRAAGGSGRDGGVEAVYAFLKKHDVTRDGVHLYGGSGLSRGDTVTARAMTELAFAMQRKPHFQVWLASLPVMGVDGDMRRRSADTPLRGKVRAKTGYITMPAARTLAGYLEARSGRRFCFAFLLNNHTNSIGKADADVDGALLDLYKAL